MYTLNDGRRIYVAPFVARRISELGIQAGESFKICKRHVKTGQRKTVDWLVERLDADGETQLSATCETRLKSPTRGTTDSPSAPPSLGSRKTGACTSPADSSKLRNSRHGRHRCERLSEWPPHLVHTPATENGNQPPPDTQLAHALKTAIAAAVEAEKFAKTLDYNIRFTTDDVRSMGITILIGMQQRLR